MWSKTTSEVLSRFYVGSADDSLDVSQMKKNQIGAVVRAVRDAEKMQRCKMDPHPIYKFVELEDMDEANVKNWIHEVNDFVHEQRLHGNAVLIHCMAGISRSVSLAIAYVMTVTNYGYDDSLRLLENSREEANPNRGFRIQLRDFETKSLKEERERIRKKFGLKDDEDRLGDNAYVKHRLSKIKKQTDGP